MSYSGHPRRLSGIGHLGMEQLIHALDNAIGANHRPFGALGTYQRKAVSLRLMSLSRLNTQIDSARLSGTFWDNARGVMRTLFVSVCLLALSSSEIQAADGNFLQEICKAKKDTEIIAYIAGWMDKRSNDVGNFNRTAEAPGAPDVQPMRFLKHALGGNICFPAKLDAQQTRDVLCQYLDKNPQSRHLRGSTLVWEAFNKAWPCKE